VLFTELEFTRLLKSEVSSPAVSTAGFQLVRTVADLKAMVERLRQAPHLVLDTETSSLDPLLAELAGISLCVSEQEAFYIAIGHRDQEGKPLPGQLDAGLVIETLRPLLEDPGLPKIGHNLKFDFAVLANHGVRLAGPLQDTMLASYLINPLRRTHGLDALCPEVLDLAPTSFAAVTCGDKRPDCFLYVPLEAAKDYSCEDVYCALRLWKHFKPILEREGLLELFANLEAPLIPILADMELAGIMVDLKLLQELAREFGEKLMALERDIYRLAGGDLTSAPASWERSS
jgi:DNA polymerase-1